MQLNRDMGHNSSNNIEARALIGWSVGHVLRRTLGEIVRNIRVEGLSYTMHRRSKLLGTLVRVFHICMQQWAMS